ncbi:MAG: toll/interleukin-1 receptor domain-containing protein [Gammaproteobacteria bacterium]
MTRDVFISYSQPDRDCALELVARLEGEGIRCWIAPRDIAPSADWAAEIMDAISVARTMILVFSASSNQSPQVRREVERAVHKQLSILPFRIEDVLPSKSLKYFLSAQHWMDAFAPPRELHYARLCAHLKGQLDISSAPAMGSATIAQLFDAADLHRIERHLAGYIGPIAKHLVKSATTRAASIEDLVVRLAAELDTEADRYEFSRQCRNITPLA